MKKIFTLFTGLALTMSASALTLEDLTGNYELQNPYGSITWVATSGTINFGMDEEETAKNMPYVNSIKVTTDGTYLYFSNFLNLSFYATVDLEAMKVTIPVQYVKAATGYSFTQCLFDVRMFPQEGEDKATFTDDDAQDIVLDITADGDLTLWREGENGESGYADYIAHWGWSTNYGYITGTFHKTSDFVADASLESIIGTHECTEFSGEWCSIWGDWDNTYSIWNNFDITTGEGIELLGVDAGTFPVVINTVGGLDVEVCGLWWGALNISGQYDPETKTITFPLQNVWGGYTLCNSSLCDVEVPTNADIVPATAVVNEDGTITMNYTVEYTRDPYLFAKQQLSSKVGFVESIETENSNAPIEYFNLQGMKVNPEAGNIYIMRQGNKVSKKIIK